MSGPTFGVEVITPEKLKYRGDATLLHLQGEEGQMGILAHHAPLLALLGPGEIRIRVPSEREVRLAAGAGFVKVLQNKAVVLVDFAEMPEEIDSRGAEEALAQALRDRQAAGAGDRPAAERAVQAARARIAVARAGQG